LGHAQTAQRKIEDGQSNYTSEAQERINRTYPMRQDTSEAIEVATSRLKSSRRFLLLLIRRDESQPLVLPLKTLTSIKKL